MNRAYELLGATTVFPVPADPAASQSLPMALRMWWRLRHHARARSATIVSFEIAGRGIAEMWAAWLLTRSGRRVWVTLHDVPTLCGPSLLTRTLDRRGGRRLGLLLSRRLGFPVERDLLHRADQVFTLSRSGTAALSEAYTLERPVVTLPHVLARGPGVPIERRIFVPGYVGTSDAVHPLIRLLPRLPADWRLVVGAASEAVSQSAAALAAELGVTDNVELIGFLDEDDLDLEFSRAAIVVRWREGGWLRGTADYAVSGPLIRAMGRGCAIVTNDRRGAAECLDDAGATTVGNGEDGAAKMITAVSRFVHDDDLRSTAAEAGLAHISRDHDPQVIARVLSEAIS